MPRLFLAALGILLWLSALQAAGEEPKTILFLIGEDEYDTHLTLPAFAKKQLEPLGLRCEFVHADEDHAQGFPDIGKLDKADLLFVSVRRRSLPNEQMKVLKDYIATRKPIVGIRTASHAFALRSGEPPEGHAVWPEFDREVLGGHYTGHYPANDKEGPNSKVNIVEERAAHAILKNVAWKVDETKWFTSWLYQSKITGDHAEVLLVGNAESKDTENPVAWTNTTDGRRVFYTSLGHAKDFDEPAFQQILKNAVLWALEKDTAK